MRQSASSACFWSGPGFAEGIMASGHAYRTNRSNTWPHRPGSAERQINPCQRGAVHTWRISDGARVGNLDPSVAPLGAASRLCRLILSVIHWPRERRRMAIENGQPARHDKTTSPMAPPQRTTSSGPVETSAAVSDSTESTRNVMIAGQFVRLRSPPLTGAPVIGCPELWPPLAVRLVWLTTESRRLQ